MLAAAIKRIAFGGMRILLAAVVGWYLAAGISVVLVGLVDFALDILGY